MKPAELARIARDAKCKVIGLEDAGNAGHRLTLAALIRTFDASESRMLCEASLANRVGKADRSADIVLIDPEIGVHVFEVKGITLDRIVDIKAGSKFAIRYGSSVRRCST